MFAEGAATREVIDVNAEYRSSALGLNKEAARNNRQVKWGIFGWIFGRWNVGVWTGWSWLRIGTGGVRL
jgi:hypothetical protein